MSEIASSASSVIDVETRTVFAPARCAKPVAGVNSNVLTDHAALDPLSGRSVLNGNPVTLVAR